MGRPTLLETPEEPQYDDLNNSQVMVSWLVLHFHVKQIGLGFMWPQIIGSLV